MPTLTLDAVLALPHRERMAWADSLTPEERAALLYHWPFWARGNQLPPPGDWRTWFIDTGRAWGKTRTAAEFIRTEVMAGRMSRVALVAPTAADARDVVVEGESGIVRVHSPQERPVYEPSKRRLTWPNGAMATVYSADEPDRLRGPQHDGAWADEIASWRFPEAWDMLQMGLRLGRNPRQVATSTPKPMRLIRQLLADPTVTVTRGHTDENRRNLAPVFFDRIVAKYRGTRLGRQELAGELLEDMPGALWTRAMFDANRRPKAPDLVRIMVGVDPSIGSGGEGQAECGIVIAGKGADGHGYVLADRSARLSPHGWAQRAVQAYLDFKADRIVAEQNQGGEMVRETIRTVDPNVPVTLVTASRSKRARAEPVAALYEQGRVYHIEAFEELEDQLCTWTPESGESPDRLDALVWVFTELMLGTVAKVWL